MDAEGPSPGLQDISDAAQQLVDARENGRPIGALPSGLAPRSVAQAYAIQDEMIARLGEVGGWKIAPRPNGGEFLCSPIPKTFFFEQQVRIGPSGLMAPEIEMEVAIRIGRDLPPKPGLYSVAEVMDAVASLHPIFEVLSSRFVNRKLTDPLSNIADLQSCGAVVVGPACRDWKQIEMSTTPLAMHIDGREVGSVSGGASSYHVFAALTWLANHAVARRGGLRAGQVIITGARVGPVAVTAGAQVTGAAGMLGELRTAV